jgi:hypothetical protein
MSRPDTMTVDELIMKLQNYPMDMPVIATWETTHNRIDHDSFKVSTKTDFNQPCLVIDVDNHIYGRTKE